MDKAEEYLYSSARDYYSFRSKSPRTFIGEYRDGLCGLALWHSPCYGKRNDATQAQGVLVKRKAVRRWNEAWVCVLASSAGLVTTARTNMP